jgi:hypothetical protein
MGGPTTRMLAHLLAKGSQEEMNAAKEAGVEPSRLFWTNRTYNPTVGVVTVAGALQGSTFADFLSSKNLILDFVVGFAKLLIAVDPLFQGHLWDFQLDHVLF